MPGSRRRNHLFDVHLRRRRYLTVLPRDDIFIWYIYLFIYFFSNFSPLTRRRTALFYNSRYRFNINRYAYVSRSYICISIWMNSFLLFFSTTEASWKIKCPRSPIRKRDNRGRRSRDRTREFATCNVGVAYKDATIVSCNSSRLFKEEKH